jgi:hypothetical protein
MSWIPVRTVQRPGTLLAAGARLRERHPSAQAAPSHPAYSSAATLESRPWPPPVRCGACGPLYERTPVAHGTRGKGDLALSHLAFYSGARRVLKVLAYLIERGDYEELHEIIKR